MADTAALAGVLGRRPAKTRKGRKILESREPQALEGAKTALIIRGNRSSAEVASLLRDLHRLRDPLAQLFMRKHPEHPFEDTAKLEALCKKQDHSLFAFGSSSKKRPFRLILGRLFNNRLLDMQEFNVESYKSLQSFRCSKQETMLGAKPMVVFQGAAFDSDERLKRTKSLLLDFFRGPTPEQVMLQGLEHVIVCSTFDAGAGAAKPEGAAAAPPPETGNGKVPTVTVRRFRVLFSKSGSRLPRVELEEVGPHMRLALDRVKDPDRDRWKQSIKVPKGLKPKKVKSVTNDKQTGKKRGRIHLGKQDFNQIHTVHHGKTKEKKLKADLGKQGGDADGA
mmetsp:Transcript_72505/g.225216  ORF Transcript_72505/g.225216 Transcript_72505/m.225216 type:complete len:337 (-) Transcript_72505:97-1107(-)